MVIINNSIPQFLHSFLQSFLYTVNLRRVQLSVHIIINILQATVKRNGEFFCQQLEIKLCLRFKESVVKYQASASLSLQFCQLF